MVTGWCVAGLVVLCLLLFGHCYVFARYRSRIPHRNNAVIGIAHSSRPSVVISPRRPVTHSSRPVMHSPATHSVGPVMHSPNPPGGVRSHHQSEHGSCQGRSR